MPKPRTIPHHSPLIGGGARPDDTDSQGRRPVSGQLPDIDDVHALTQLLDIMANFPSNEQRARYLLTCDWMRDRDAQTADTDKEGNNR